MKPIELIGYMPLVAVKESGVYTLVHLKSGYRYTGRTTYLYAQLTKHINDLAKGRHRTLALQIAFDDDPRFELTFCAVQLTETAQAGLTKHWTKVRVNGIVYESLEAVAKAHACNAKTVKNRCKNHNFPSWEFVS